MYTKHHKPHSTAYPIYNEEMMAKYKPYSQAQGQFIPVFFHKQLQVGTFEYTLNHLVDNVLDLSFFDNRYNNDETGAPAYDPRILIKVILFAYSRGITSSRAIARCCEENVIFMALSSNSRPHFTTIADFIATMDQDAMGLFLEVLLVCDQHHLIGKEMFAIDGCKMPSNASKEWSGTKADFKRKVAKMELAIERMVAEHRSQDSSTAEEGLQKKAANYTKKLEKTVDKIKDWLDNNNDRTGTTGKPVKSNITDNDSAKMQTSKGVIQGYVGVAAVDGKHQVIIQAEAYGLGQEHNLLVPTLESIRHNFIEIGSSEDVLTKAVLTADSGYHSEKNMEYVFTENIDGYIADPHFRKRDPRFINAERYKEKPSSKSSVSSARKFTPADFTFPEDLSFCVCPAGQRLYRSGGNVTIKNRKAVKFKGSKSACRPCHLRKQCLQKPEKTEYRQVAYFTGRTTSGDQSFTDKMKAKIDSSLGRAMYSMRQAVGEPTFAHIRSIMGLDRFSLRGKEKVNAQWNLFAVVHNLKKIHKYGECFS